MWMAPQANRFVFTIACRVGPTDSRGYEGSPDQRHACGAGSEGSDSPADSLHHWQRGLRALQLLRDAQHPDGLPVDVALRLSAAGGAWAGSEGDFPHVRDWRLLFSAVGRLAGRSVLREIQHDLLAEPGLLPGASVSGVFRDEPARVLYRAVADCARVGRDQAVRCGIRR